MSEKYYRSHSYGERVLPGSWLKIERGISLIDTKIDLAKLVQHSPETLQTMRDSSTAKEQAIFEKLQAVVVEWEEQAAGTMLINSAIEYLRIPKQEHTSNQWVENEHGWHSISNMVYKMTYRVNVTTVPDHTTGQERPVNWELNWSIYAQSPNPSPYSRQSDIGGQKKRFGSKEEMEKYLAGRIQKYAGYFTEISPAIPEEHADIFKVNGCLLPGYTLLGSDLPKEKPRCRDQGAR